MNKFAIFVLVVCMTAVVVCDVTKETRAASSDQTKQPEGEKHKSIFSKALNLTKDERIHLKEVYDKMTNETKAACTPEQHKPEEQAAWKAITEDEKIVKIQAKWAAKTEEQKACAFHIHQMNKEHHKEEEKNQKKKVSCGIDGGGGHGHIVVKC